MIFHFNTRVLQKKKSLLTYHTIRVFVLFWTLFCSINHIHSKLTTFTPWLRDHKQYSRHLKYFFLCSKFVYWLQFILVGCSFKTMCPEWSYFLWITSCKFPTFTPPMNILQTLGMLTSFYTENFVGNKHLTFLQVKIKSKLHVLPTFCYFAGLKMCIWITEVTVLLTSSWKLIFKSFRTLLFCNHWQDSVYVGDEWDG